MGLSYKIKTLSLILAVSLVFSAEQAACSTLGARRNLLDSVGTVFDVTTFGAKPDGKFDNTQALIKAWNAACKAPGAAPRTLAIPVGNFMCGEVVFQGPCTGPMTIDLKGTLSANPDLSLYTQGVWLEIEDITGITLTGGGTIDGKGPDVWQYAPKNGGGDSLLPVGLQFSHVTQGAINNIKLVNNMGFHSKVTWSKDVTVSDISVTAPGDSPNTDGLHISSSSNVNVTNMIVGTGDDCISIGEGNTNIFVSKVTCGPGHGISIGSLGKRPDEKNVSGIKVINCTLTNTTNGARIKTYHDSPKLLATGIIYEDIVMNQVANPILIDQHYASKKVATPSNVQIADVHFRNIRGTTVSPVVVALNCSEAVPCKDVELADINFTPFKPGPALTSTCFNSKPAVLGTQNIALDKCAA